MKKHLLQNSGIVHLTMNKGQKYIFFALSALLMIAVLPMLQSCKEKPVDEKQLARDKITLRTLGLAYLEENKLKEAEEQFQKLTELAPDESLGYANLGLVYLRMDNYKKALEQLDKAVKIDPKDAGIRLIKAKAFELNGQKDKAVHELEATLAFSPKDAKTLYQLADLYQKSGDAGADKKRMEYLSKVVAVTPTNIVPRLQLMELLLQEGEADEALKNLEEIGQQFAEFTPEAGEFYKKTIDALHNNNVKEALTSLLIFHNFLKLTTPYQAGIKELKGPGGALIGFPVITFSENTTSMLQEGESILDVMKFSDVTATAGLQSQQNFTPPNSHLSVADFDGDGDQDIYFGGTTPDGTAVHNLLINDLGMFKAADDALPAAPNGSRYAAAADYDNDGHLDIFTLGDNKPALFRNASEGTFEDTSDDAFENTGAFHGNKGLFLDMDHDGDLDIAIGDATDKMLRNNGSGSFDDASDQSGLTANTAPTRDLALGDFDDDGDIDFIAIREDGKNILYSNLRQGKFEDASAKAHLPAMQSAGAVAVGDYNNDGSLDLLISTLDGSPWKLLMNNNDGTFEEDNTSAKALAALQTIKGYDVTFFDFDNDGHLDILALGEPIKEGSRGAYLFHNDAPGKFSDVSHLLPKELEGGRMAEIADYNEDGDLDLYVVDLHGNLRLFRNDGGNANHHLKMNLVGLRTGSGKNNHFGIGAKVEVRAGSLYQMQVVTSAGIHFGMGSHTKADVVRIMWTNGVPQNMFFPSSDRSLIEEQELKGSCPFLYAWNGERFVFVKDMMWRSALGMPLGIMGGKKAYAFADASVEYLKIPGELMQPKDGAYTLQMTEELWETIYADQVRLLAVDHPAGTQIFVNEKFEAPPYSPLRIYSVREQHIPIAATDAHSNNLRDLIATKDHRYISNFSREKYQGITEMKDLILNLGQVSDPHNIYLFLNGWIFPTDASINVALSQAGDLALQHPSLEVINQHGKWQKVIDNIGFPSGKNKTVIVDLSDKFLSDDHRIRIRTNMEIYWDHIFFARDEGTTHTITPLPPAAADHHYRGFSAMHRLDGRYGPHWFDYDQVTTGQKWRDLTGNYTRYGDVTDLLQAADDRYIIADAGDETTLHFDAKKLPKIHDGYTRDFLIYSVGWVKDGDLNTALGQTVAPLPFHGMSRYPYGPGEHYPDDPAHRAYQQQYNTRQVNTGQYKNFVRKGYH